MSARKLLSVAMLLCCIAVVAPGCGRTPPPEAEAPVADEPEPEEAEGAPEEAASVEATPAPEPTDMMCIKNKCMALGKAAEAKDLDKIKAAGKDLCGAICAYKPKKPELCKDDEFMKMRTMCIETCKKIEAAKTVDEAAKLVTDAKSACQCCHAKYKPMPAKAAGK